MTKEEILITSVIGMLVIAASVHADMMPVSQEDAVFRQSTDVRAQVNLYSKTLPDSFSCAGAANLDLWSTGLLPEASPASEVQNLRSLTEGPNSLKFCLSALLSLGLCCSAQWVKRISLGFVPDWYYEGGTFQVGHSHAILSSTLYPIPVCCFVQPASTEYNPDAQYRLEIVILFWRKSQITPIMLATRGPPIY